MPSTCVGIQVPCIKKRFKVLLDLRAIICTYIFYKYGKRQRKLNDLNQYKRTPCVKLQSTMVPFSS